ncbi:bifunctional 3-(3-hydroxy-phenyl)propionate/3-hydroxycinnamic acid hydroxylase [Duganella radicis]|uniref:Bifunctional 3-(3-hydroxy-phenyl)propionate/3-hydroxycinnamic acid hydroxylase n=1 Tax=Duganella radicis TaxID=551988 RepID=A0A6L6PE74_9BURK|nr:bifunctional 3-(3-hydroxy-phenyl)propionate/3-hydroxycinnamic acid hydroxylase [Duganella radicis]MTV37019.1 bifunctional 3-(3-hydroxy-phenyl)propionate/3-hydroxycinnamic acid hydroxylase [Duganella radicis]
MDFDLLIIGMGPVGAVAANLAGSWGLNTLAVDKMLDIYDKPRAFGLDQEVMRIFGNLGIAEQIADAVLPYRTSEYQTTGGRVIKRIAPAGAPYPLGWASNYVFSQPAVEGALRGNLNTLPGVSVELGTEVISVTPEGAGSSVLLRRHDGAESRVTARYVLACDGGTSPLRTRLGLEMEDLAFDEPWMVVDVLVKPEALGRLPETNVQFCETARPSSYIVGPGLHRRWEFTINHDETPDSIQQPEAIRKLISRWLQPHEYEIWRASAYRFHALVLKTWCQDNQFFLGDAAHMTPPFMAQGMCQGIRDASNLVWKLAMVCRGQASEALLDTYQQERLPHVRSTTLVTKGLGQVICERDPAKAAERDARMLEEMAAADGPTIRQSLIPGLASGLLAPDDAAGVRGKLFPQPRVVNSAGLSGLLDEFTGATFRLVAAPGVPLEALQQAAARHPGLPLVLARLADETASGPHDYREQDGVLAGWFRQHGCQVALVRPDHYVFGGAASAAGGAALLDNLARLLAAPSADAAEASLAA